MIEKYAFSDSKLLKLSQRQKIIEEGRPMLGVYILHAGKAKILRKDNADQTHIVRLIKAGEWLGLEDLDSDIHLASAIQIEKGFATFIPRKVIQNLLQHNIELSFDIMRSICYNIAQAETRVYRLAQKKARERVAEVLLELYNRFGTDAQEYLDIHLTLRELADFAGVASETMSRLIHDFRRKELIDLNKKRIRLRQPERLQQIAHLASASA